MVSYDRLKIVVAGDSGVGKTAFVHLLCYDEALTNPSWTIGCGIELLVFPRTRRSQPLMNNHEDNRYFMEFWDIGGSRGHANTRPVFYENIHGIVLVHDLTNKKSETNLNKWLSEITAKTRGVKVVCHSSAGDGLGASQETRSASHNTPLITIANSLVCSITASPAPAGGALGSAGLPPVLVVGTKLDQVGRSHPGGFASNGYSGAQVGAFASSHGFPEIRLNCNSSSSLAPNTMNDNVVSSFLQQVIRFKDGAHKRDGPDDYFDYTGSTNGASGGGGGGYYGSSVGTSNGAVLTYRTPVL